VRQRIIARAKGPAKQSQKKLATKWKLSIFNGKIENFSSKDLEVAAHLYQMKNEAGISIYYVIRDPDKKERYRAKNGEIIQWIYEASFQGPV
jgi:hypothetical protein